MTRRVGFVRLACALALAFLGACEGSTSVPDAAAPIPDAGTPEPTIEPRFEALARAVEQDLENNHATGASVAVWLDEEIVWVGGFGSADPEGARRPGPDTLFMIGSDTKKIAAIMLLQEIDATHLAAETTIAEALPALSLVAAPEFEGATMHALMSHQGGVADALGPYTTDTTDDALRTYVFGGFAQGVYALAPPGVFFNYANPNFSMVGLVTETLAGEPWADVARARVFEPLGMTRTVARKSEVDEDHADGVGRSSFADMVPGPVTLADTWEHAFVRPAGLVWSTPSDQMRLARFLVDGDEDVLSAERHASLHARQVPVYPDMPGHYGYGLWVQDGMPIGGGYREMEVWIHGGNTLTHTSTFVVLPAQRFAISILSNGVGDDFRGSVDAAITSLVDLPPITTEPAPVIDPDALVDLVGTYVDPHNVGDVIIEQDGAGLRVSMPALDAAGVPYSRQVTPVSTRVWRMIVQGVPMLASCYEGPDGAAYLVNRSYVARRDPPAPATPAPMRFSHHMPSRETILRALERGRPLPAERLVAPWLR